LDTAVVRADCCAAAKADDDAAAIIADCCAVTSADLDAAAKASRCVATSADLDAAAEASCCAATGADLDAAAKASCGIAEAGLLPSTIPRSNERAEVQMSNRYCLELTTVPIAHTLPDEDHLKEQVPKSNIGDVSNVEVLATIK